MPDANLAKQQIINALSEKPLLLNEIFTKLNPKINTIILGAFLSELLRDKKIKSTYLKIGTSPLYYLPEQVHKLQLFKDNLKGPEKEAFEAIESKKIILKESIEPKIRVALENLKDFAKEINITYNSRNYRFFVWYLLKKEDIKEYLKKFFDVKENKSDDKTNEDNGEYKNKKDNNKDNKNETENKLDRDETKSEDNKDKAENKLDRDETKSEDNKDKAENKLDRDEKYNDHEDKEYIKSDQDKKEPQQDIEIIKEPNNKTTIQKRQNKHKKDIPKIELNSPLSKRLENKGIRIENYKMINKKDMMFEGIIKTEFGKTKCQIFIKKKKITDSDIVECLRFKKGIQIILCNDSSKKALSNAEDLGIIISKLD